MRHLIYQKRLERDQFLRGVYAGEGGEVLVEEEGGEGEEAIDDAGRANTTNKSNHLLGNVSGKAVSSSPSPASSSSRLPVMSPDHIRVTHIHKAHGANNGNKSMNKAINNTTKSNAISSNSINGNKGTSSSRPHSAGARASSDTISKASSSTRNRAGGGGVDAAVWAKPLVQAHHTAKQEDEEEQERMLTRRLHHLVDVMQKEVEEEWCARYQRAVKDLDQKLGEDIPSAVKKVKPK